MVAPSVAHVEQNGGIPRRDSPACKILKSGGITKSRRQTGAVVDPAPCKEGNGVHEAVQANHRYYKVSMSQLSNAMQLRSVRRWLPSYCVDNYVTELQFTVIQTFRQPTAAFISEQLFTDEGSRRLPKRLNYCFSVLASATNRSI